LIELASGDYAATVTPVGGALVSLRHHDRDLVLNCPGEQSQPAYCGAVLAPWPNRIADGRYTYAGVEHQLTVNEVGRGCALHGLVHGSTWRVLDEDEDHVRLTETIRSQPGYPFTVAVQADYRLAAVSGLTVTVTARNAGAGAAPYGTAIHPYLVAGPGCVDDWALDLDAAEVLDVDYARLLPKATRPVDGTAFDFRGGRRIGAAEIDHALTAVHFGADGTAAAKLTAPDGRGVQMTWGGACRWVQVHTTDLPGRPAHRRGLAFEPMTCPPDAFNSGTDLIDLQPGEFHKAWWRIATVPSRPAG
jgi:aldose 1-epimerase